MRLFVFLHERLAQDILLGVIGFAFELLDIKPVGIEQGPAAGGSHSPDKPANGSSSEGPLSGAEKMPNMELKNWPIDLNIVILLA